MTTSTVDTQNRLLAATARDLDSHLHRNGPLPDHGDHLLSTVEESGLTGRGGAGFPAWRKLAAVRGAGRHPVVVANGAEGEPASDKDATLLRTAPHLVLDGLQLAAEAVGADRAYVYTGTTDALRRALAERRRDRVRPELVAAPDGFVSGEESAVVAAIEGRPALPRDKRRRVVEYGVGGRPTLVQNVETLAHLALIARYGAGWFREQGTDTEPGTFLATVGGAVRRPAVYEAPYGVPLERLLARAGGASEPLQAVLVGGYHGGWVPADRTDVAMARATLAPFGASPGAGVVVALPASRCGLVESARIAAYLARQSARQCGPCLNGLPRLADTLTRLAHGGRDPGLPHEVSRLAGLVAGRGACHHPDGTARFVRSSLAVFGPEVAAHLGGWCTAGGRR